MELKKEIDELRQWGSKLHTKKWDFANRMRGPSHYADDIDAVRSLTERMNRCGNENNRDFYKEDLGQRVELLGSVLDKDEQELAEMEKAMVEFRDALTKAREIYLKLR